MSNLVKNAKLARSSSRGFDDVLIVAGDNLEAQFWQTILSEADTPGSPSFSVERGKKGNLLGALQAYSALRSARSAASIEQIVMLFGSGTRLSPFTQALRNIKAAFPLPDGDRGAAGITVGEAAIRSSAPWVGCLQRAGFAGVLVTWGDEVLIPSAPLDVPPANLATADVVRFGWRTDPNQQLATQKEWLQVDMHTGMVLRDVARQPIDQLTKALRSTTTTQTSTYVNLGSFAASHEFLSLACEAFGVRIFDETSAANWDPYFWQALQSPSHESWNALVKSERDSGVRGVVDLLETIPDFFEIVQGFRSTFERHFGHPIRVSVLDFGQPYWIDAGNHVSLSRALSAIFADGEEGASIRAFLGLPDSLADGQSFVADSSLAADCKIMNSVVIGTTIKGDGSSVEGSIVLGNNLGRLVSTGGASIIWCRADEMRVDGPNGIAFRVDGDRCVVHGDQSVASLLLDDDVVDLTYDAGVGPIGKDAFQSRILGNPVSFSEAASLVSSLDPVELHRLWQARIAG